MSTNFQFLDVERKNMGFYLKKKDVERIGAILVELATRFPRTMGTETQLSPPLLAMLQLVDLNSSFEWQAKAGRIDFRTSGTNPSLLELAVAPRILGPGDQANQLYPSQNRPELKKLASENGASKYLLLIDLERDDPDYEPNYRKWAKENGLQSKLHVVSVGKNAAVKTFLLDPAVP